MMMVKVQIVIDAVPPTNRAFDQIYMLPRIPVAGDVLYFSVLFDDRWMVRVETVYLTGYTESDWQTAAGKEAVKVIARCVYVCGRHDHQTKKRSWWGG